MAGIEDAIGAGRGFTVARNQRLPHLITGTLREFDVVVTFQHEHHALVTAFECKDLRRCVSVKDVEAFKTKLDGSPVNRGCLVSSSGFTAEAMRLAAAYKIECFSIDEVPAVDWLDASRLARAELTPTGFFCIVDFDPGECPEPESFELIRAGGGKVSDYDLYCEAIERLPFNHEWNGPGWCQIYLDRDPPVYAVSPSGCRHRILALEMRLHFDVDLMLSGPLRFHRYTAGGSAFTVASAVMEDGATINTAIAVRKSGASTGFASLILDGSSSVLERTVFSDRN